MLWVRVRDRVVVSHQNGGMPELQIWTWCRRQPEASVTLEGVGWRDHVSSSAYTSWEHELIDRHRRMEEIWRISMNAARQTLVIWSWKDSVWSKVTPRYLNDALNGISESPILADELSILLKRFAEPIDLMFWRFHCASKINRQPMLLVG